MKNYVGLMIGLVAVSLVALTGCVSKSRFLEAEQNTAACQEREKGLQQRLADLDQQLTTEKQKSSRLQNNIDQLNFKMNGLLKQNQNYEDRLSTKTSEEQMLNLNLQNKKAELEEREKTIANLQAMITKQKQVVDALMEHLKKALVGFSSDELSIELKNGKVYVALSDQLLFSSGSVKIDQNGKKALGRLAEVLRKQPDIDIMIEGHTDSVPITTSRFKDNWDLSVLRATAVVRELLENKAIAPKRLLPSGRGQYFPVASNDTPEGRSHNRRTEIILSPNLDELFNLMRGNAQ